MGQPFYFGDSVAGLLHGTRGGSGSSQNNNSGFTVIGASPSQILQNVSRLTPAQISQMASSGVVLSSGTNNPRDTASTLQTIRALIDAGVPASMISATNVNGKVAGASDFNKSLGSAADELGIHLIDISDMRVDRYGHPNLGQFSGAVNDVYSPGRVGPSGLPFDAFDSSNPFDSPTPPNQAHFSPGQLHDSGPQSNEDWIRDYWNNFNPADVANHALTDSFNATTWGATTTANPYGLPSQPGIDDGPDLFFSPSYEISQQYSPQRNIPHQGVDYYDDSSDYDPAQVFTAGPDSGSAPYWNRDPEYKETPPETYTDEPSYVRADYPDYDPTQVDYADQPGNMPPPPMEFMSPETPSYASNRPHRSGNTGPGGGAPVGGSGQVTGNWANSLPSISNFYNNMGFAPGGGGYITQFIDALQRQGAPPSNSNSPGGFSPIPVELAPGGVGEDQFAAWMASGGGGGSLAQLLNPPRQA